jgi:hypothetical protein
MDDKIDKIVHKCSACGGSDIVFGYLGGTSNIFVPSGVFTMNGFRTRTFVCLKCGHVNQYLSKLKLEKLREKFKSQELEIQ